MRPHSLVPWLVFAEALAWSDTTSDRELRLEPVVALAPVPVRDFHALRGDPGFDDDGWPRAVVDRPALRSLLWHRRYRELTQAFVEFQDAFEANPRKEYWPMDADDAFAS